MGYFFLYVGAGGLIGNVLGDWFFSEPLNELATTRALMLMATGAILLSLDDIKRILKGGNNG